MKNKDYFIRYEFLCQIPNLLRFRNICLDTVNTISKDNFFINLQNDFKRNNVINKCCNYLS